MADGINGTGGYTPSTRAADFGCVEDGFGSAWPLCKADCEIHVVRPGKAACYPCDEAEGERHVADAIANGACPKCSRHGTAYFHCGRPCDRWVPGE